MWFKDKKFFWLLGVLVVVFGVLILIKPTHAQTGPIYIWKGLDTGTCVNPDGSSGGGCTSSVDCTVSGAVCKGCLASGDCDLTSGETFFLNLINIILKFVGVAALVGFIYGGITWITSGGSPDKVKRGKDALVGSVIGVAIVLFAYIIIYTIINVLAPPTATKLFNGGAGSTTKCVSQFGSKYDCRDESQCNPTTIKRGYCPGEKNIVCCQAAISGPGNKQRNGACNSDADCQQGNGYDLTCVPNYLGNKVCAAVSQVGRGVGCWVLQNPATECKSGMHCAGGAEHGVCQ